MRNKGETPVEQMTGRARVHAALTHLQPDRVPLDLGGMNSSSMVVEGYERLKRHFGVMAETRLADRMQRTVEIEEPILQALAIDTRRVPFGTPDAGLAADLGPRLYRDMWGVVRQNPEGSYYFDLKECPLAGEISKSDILKYPWPNPDDPGFVRGVKERVQWIRAHTECAAVLALPAPFVHISQYLRGFEDWFCDCAADMERLEVLFDAVMDVTLQLSRNLLRAVGQEIDVMFFADDLGAQHGLIVSRDLYLKYIKPRHRKFVQALRDLSPAIIAFHSCGSVADLIEDFIEIGVQCLNPVQTSAAGMVPAELKQKYGGRMAFWGGTDSQQTVPRGTPDEVRRMVERLVEDLGGGGGLVFANGHNIQPDVPVENVLAMFEHARAYVPSCARG
jgi:uroporphyrinogen decarboxylase